MLASTNKKALEASCTVKFSYRYGEKMTFEWETTHLACCQRTHFRYVLCKHRETIALCVSYYAVSFRISDIAANSKYFTLRLDETTDIVEGTKLSCVALVVISMEHDLKIFWVFMG
jgi:hypothetical protein